MISNCPFGYWSFKLKEGFGKMSSVISDNINQHKITNRRTITINIDIQQGTSRTLDLTQKDFGYLDFQPDFCNVNYICYSSEAHDQGHISHNNIEIMTCNFIEENNLLCPFYHIQAIQSFNNLKYTCKKNFDFRNATFQVKWIYGNQQNDAPKDPHENTGVVVCSMEFIRYARLNDF